MDNTNTFHKIETLAEFEVAGIACVITKHKAARYEWHCVYYGVLPSHPLHGEHWRLWSRVLDKTYLTYDSGGCLTGTKHPLEVLANFPGRWWVGWDTLMQEGEYEDFSDDVYQALARSDIDTLADVEKDVS